MSLFCLDLKLISTCVVLAPSTVDSSSPFLLIDLSFCLCIYMSVCQPVAAASCHSSMSSLPVVVDLGVCLTFLLVA